MTKILVVTGSVRPASVNEKVVTYVKDALAQHAVEIVDANLAELNLPFFDDPQPPTSPDFAPQNEQVQKWTQLVNDADGVVLVTPEYNHTLSPVQLNAIDWVGKEWQDKPVSLVGYGWTSGAGQAHATAREVLAVNLKARVLDGQTNLFFTKDLDPTGEIIDADSVNSKIAATLDELVTTVNE